VGSVVLILVVRRTLVVTVAIFARAEQQQVAGHAYYEYQSGFRVDAYKHYASIRSARVTPLQTLRLARWRRFPP